MNLINRIKQTPYALKKYGLKSFAYNTVSIVISDVVIVSFQKCGKTWLRVMLSKILEKKYNIKKVNLDLQFMTIFKRRAPNILITHAGSTKDNNNINFRKVFKNKKIILLVRDPKDSVVSLFHSARTREKIYDKDNITEFIHNPACGLPKIINFMNDWAEEMQLRPKEFILVRYEDMKNNTENELKRILNFMNIQASEELIKEAVEYGSFENMRKLEMTNTINDYRMKPGNVKDPNSFRTRKGKVGSYKEELSAEEIKYMNHEIHEKLHPLFQQYK